MKLSEYAGERDDAQFWARAAPRREPARARWFVPGVLIALLLSVPWYWGDATGTVAGLPLWVWGTLACSAGLSALTGFAAFFAWEDDPPEEDPGGAASTMPTSNAARLRQDGEP